MDVVLLFNGLGNQMSQYAFYLAKKKQDASTKCIYYPDPLTCQHNGYELDRLFGIQRDTIAESFLERFFSVYLWSQVCDSRKRHWLRVVMRWLRVEKVEEPSFDYHEEMMIKQDGGYRFYSGGWHQPEYMREVESEVREAFRFDMGKVDEHNKKLVEEMMCSQSVALHVRRGDFLKESKLFGNIATPKYYAKAIAYIKDHVDSPVFYVFSDDIAWCRENIRDEYVCFVDWNSGADSWKDMMLMSKCKHNINANSTFSWWGAWLNDNPDKIVVVPDRFMNRAGSEKIFPQEWVKIQRDE